MERKQLAIDLPAADHKRIKEAALEMGIPMKSLILLAVAAYIKYHANPKISERK